jgi:DNA-binding winged helix-turn-helix (wHTH) protein/Tol biopolymer transport system component
MVMERQSSESYEFGNFRFNPRERSLLHNGEPIALTPKALDTLFALVSRSGHLVTKEELLEEVWQDAFVEEATVVQNISTLRKVLSRDGAENKFIETVPKRGYRFVASVQPCRDDEFHNPIIENLVTKTARGTGSNGNGDKARAANQQLAQLRGPQLPEPGISHEKIDQTTPSANWKRSSYVVVGLVAALVLGVFVVGKVRQKRSTGEIPVAFERMSLSQITQTGKAKTSAISPDGNYVAYIVRDAGKESLWIRQVTTPNDARIIPPAEVHYLALTFAPDGGSVYFVTYEKGQILGNLYRIPVIGGTPQRVIADLDSPVTFSRDGKQLAFVRGYPASKETALVVSNTDGTGEQKLASRTFPSFFSVEGPAWSPSGNLIACGVRMSDALGISETVVGVDPVSRQEKQITDQRWAEVGRLSWDQKGERIILSAAKEYLAWHQLWQISWPSGLANRITNDLTNYRGVSLASGANALTTVATEINSSLWITSGSQYHASQIESTINDGLGGIAWTPDNQLVFTSKVGGHAEIWAVDIVGGAKRPLTSDNRRDFAPSVTSDGKYLLYSSAEEAKPAKVWRRNIDGSNPKQLTFGNDDRFPACSFDGKWVFYSSFSPNQQERYDEKLWKVPLAGGDSTLVVDQSASQPIFSPDGKLIAFPYQAAPDQPWKIRVISYETTEVVKDLPASRSALSLMQWAPDGRGFTYVETVYGVSNIWLLPLDGGSPKQITHFDTFQIFRYAWSVDGKRLALVRGVQNGDVVLIRNFVS